MARPSMETLSALKEQYNIGTRAAFMVWKARQKRAQLIDDVLGEAGKQLDAAGFEQDLPERNDLEVLLGLFGEVQGFARRMRAERKAQMAEQKWGGVIRDSIRHADESASFLVNYAVAYGERGDEQDEVRRRVGAFADVLVSYVDYRTRGRELAEITEHHKETLEFIFRSFAERQTAGRQELSSLDFGDKDRKGKDSWYERMELEGTLDSIEYQRLALARLVEQHDIKRVRDLQEFYYIHNGCSPDASEKEKYLYRIIESNHRWLENYLRA